MFSSLREEGQGLVEYALIIVFVAIVVILIVMLFGDEVANLYQNVVTALQAL